MLPLSETRAHGAVSTPAVRFAPDATALHIIDQTCLPGALVELSLTTLPAMVEAIRSLRVRGAPAIGVAGAVGLAVLAERCALENPATFDGEVALAADALRAARPTAVNLAWAVDRVVAAGQVGGGSPTLRARAMRDEATAILDEDVAMCARIGEHGATLLARHHGVPFYVLAPTSTLDADTPNGEGMPIEMRAPDEVRSLHGVATAPAGAAVYNPAFDVTPAALVSAIVTDRGVFHPPYHFTH